MQILKVSLLVLGVFLLYSSILVFLQVFINILQHLWPWIYLDAPHGAAVVQGGVQLPHTPHVFHVPHIHTVVVVHTGQVFGSGVKGQGQRVGVLSTWTGR